MKRAWSRKNLWAALPSPLRAAAGRALALLPLERLLGRSFRETLALARAVQRWPAEQSEAYQLLRLREVLSLAQASPYYRELFSRAGFCPQKLRSLRELEALPLLDRDTVREQGRRLCTGAVDRPGVDYVTTGGTSGKPLGFYIGAERSGPEFAHLVAGWERIGYRLGTPLAVFRGHVVALRRGGLRHAYDPLLRQHQFSSFHLDDGSLEAALRRLDALPEFFLHVYPSSGVALARHLRRTGRRPPPGLRGILAESEIVYPEQRQLMETAFGRPLHSSYGLSEKVVAAAGCRGSGAYHIWPTYGYCELVRPDGSVIRQPGERGEIVGTGFLNRVMPFIRYRTGDMATWTGSRCPHCGMNTLLLEEIRGHRSQESLVTADGSEIAWTAINMHDDTFDRVRQLQFRQEVPGRATLRLAPGAGFGPADAARIRRRLEARLAGRIAFEIELVDSIPLSPRGKAIYVDQRIDRAALHGGRPAAPRATATSAHAPSVT